MIGASLDPALGWLLVVLFGLLFASGAWHKLRSIEDFTAIVVAYRLFPEQISRRVALFIPTIELGTGASLLWKPSRPVAAASACVLMVAYSAAIAINLHRRRRDIGCGCGASTDRRPIASWMIWRNASMCLFIGIAALPWSTRPLGIADIVTLTGGFTVAVALYLALDRLLGDIAPKAAAMRGAS